MTILDAFRKQFVESRVAIISAAVLLGLSVLFFIVISLVDTDRDIPAVDYDRIRAEGVGTTATITDIEMQYDVTVNHDHPAIIHYKYIDNGREVTSKFRTLEPERVSQLRIGGEVQIKFQGNESILTDFEPFDFPLELFYIIPIVFLGMGIAIVVYLTKRTLKDVRGG